MQENTSLITIQALEKASLAHLKSVEYFSGMSATAECFEIRAPLAIFNELERIAELNGRSKNAEIIAAIITTLGNYRVLNATEFAFQKILDSQVTNAINQKHYFNASEPDECRKLIVRFPKGLRQIVRHTIHAEKRINCRASGSMNKWITASLAIHINRQMKHTAYLEAIMQLVTM